MRRKDDNLQRLLSRGALLFVGVVPSCKKPGARQTWKILADLAPENGGTWHMSAR